MKTTNPPFLLLRGLMREQRHWGDFPSVLQQQFPNTEMMLLDIPGNGSLYQLESPKTIAAMTESLRLQLQQAGRVGQINLLALSMGGMIALDWMNRYPAEINAGILVNTSVSRYAPFYQRLRWQCYGQFLTLCRQTPAKREQSILQLTTNHQQHNAELLANWQLWQQQQPVALKNALHQIIASATFKCTQKPSQPLLIVTSKADRLVDYRCSVALHRAWNCAFEQHQSAGHDLPLDAPLWLSEVIKNWFITDL